MQKGGQPAFCVISGFCRTARAAKNRGAGGVFGYNSAISSISASTPFGSAFTATQERAGFSVKYFS